MKQLTDIKATTDFQREQVALGNGSAFVIWVVEQDGYLLVAIEGKGAYQFQTRTSGGYVAEKLGLLLGDADIFSEWINRELW